MAPTKVSNRLAVGIAAGIALAVLMLVATSSLTTPAAIREQAEPPVETTLFAPARSIVLEQTVVVQGVVAPAMSYTPVASTPDGSRVVTAVPVQAGERVRFGSVLVEVSGRPVLLLKGPLPAYRDLGPGDDGPDVRQLQAALADLGLYAGDVSGLYGPATADAVTRMYERAGRDPIVIGQSDLTSAVGVLRSARRAVEEAVAMADQAKSGPAEARRAAARSLRYAKEDLALAQRDLGEQQSITGATLPASEVLFVPKGPVHLVRLGAQLGGELAGAAVEVSAGDPLVEAELPGSAAARVRAGQPARVVLQDDGSELEGVVKGVTRSATLEEEPDQANRDGSIARVRTDDALPAERVGTAADVVIVTDATDDKVVAVPVSALRYTGPTTATVVTDQEEEIPVTVGMVANGWVEVRPQVGSLQEGDQVRVYGSADGGGQP